MGKAIEDLIKRRDICIKSLLNSLEHLPREMQFSIITSNLSIDDLEALAAFQARD